VERGTTGISPARKALRETAYAFNITNGGRTLFQGAKGATGLGDISFYGKYQLLKETSTLPALSFRVGVKAPTGETDQVFGSGHPDAGIGLALDKTLATNWILYANLNGVFPTGRIAGLDLQPVMSGLVAVEYLWTDNFFHHRTVRLLFAALSRHGNQGLGQGRDRVGHRRQLPDPAQSALAGVRGREFGLHYRERGRLYDRHPVHLSDAFVDEGAEAEDRSAES
jgi:hypothetical protein